MTNREKKNERTGAIVSVAFHALLLLAFLFIMAWKAPNPPAKSPGIEINFGTAEAGFGEQQPETTAEPAESTDAEPVEDSQPQPTPPTESVIKQPVTQPSPTPAAKVVTESVTQPDPSPVVQEKEAKPQPKAPSEQPKEEPKKPEPKVDSRGLMGAPSNNSNNSANQGDRQGATGDQGKQEGKVDARNLYGEAGGGQGGTDLKIAGWFWDEAPNKKDSSNETGRIVFEFNVNSEGYVGNIRTVSSTVSPTVVQFYKRQLEQTTFHRTSGGIVPDNTTGTVTFIIKAR